jgi:hypothetical protein
MTPRIFVSSTYYDLKHVRERLEQFLNNYGFEPILFESDKVTYQIDKNIDSSAYQEVGTCHVMVLIVGGRYGTAASTQDVEEEKKRYEQTVISITRREYETALLNNIPVLIFIEKNVYGEYLTFTENRRFFENENDSSKFKFAHVDHTNVFKFIDLFKNKPIKTFEKVEEIEHYIKNQFSGMFYLYLELLKQKAEANRVLNAVEELNNLTLRMNEMVNSVGKKILGTSNQEYEIVISKQFQLLLNLFVEKCVNSIAVESMLDFSDGKKINALELAQTFYDVILKDKFVLPPITPFKEYFQKKNELSNRIIDKLNKEMAKLNPEIKFYQINSIEINLTFKEEIEPFVIGSDNTNLLLKKLGDALMQSLILPF